MPTTAEPATPPRSPASEPATMQAIAVMPGKPNTMHLRRVPKPSIQDVPGGRGVLV